MDRTCVAGASAVIAPLVHAFDAGRCHDQRELWLMGVLVEREMRRGFFVKIVGDVHRYVDYSRCSCSRGIDDM